MPHRRLPTIRLCTGAVLIGAAACGPGQAPARREDQGPSGATPAPVLPPYTVIETAVDAPYKRSLTVRLDRKASEAELRALALALKAGDPRRYDRTFIVYLLPGMQPGAGAWATSHFDPDLSVRVLGLTREQERAVAGPAAAPGAGAVLGEWLDDGPGSGGRISLIRGRDSTVVRRVFGDGSNLTQRVLPRRTARGVQYRVPDSPSGDHYSVRPDGVLEIRDVDGLIRSARPLRGGTPVAPGT